MTWSEGSKCILLKNLCLHFMKKKIYLCNFKNNQWTKCLKQKCCFWAQCINITDTPEQSPLSCCMNLGRARCTNHCFYLQSHLKHWPRLYPLCSSNTPQISPQCLYSCVLELHSVTQTTLVTCIKHLHFHRWKICKYQPKTKCIRLI